MGMDVNFSDIVYDWEYEALERITFVEEGTGWCEADLDFGTCESGHGSFWKKNIASTDVHLTFTRNVVYLLILEVG